MRTDLFALAHAIDPKIVEGAIPPACRTPVAAPPSSIVRDAVVIESPPWRPRRPARHFMPALSVLARDLPSFRFELAIETRGRWSPWVASTTLGDEGFTPLSESSAELTCDIDVFTSREPADAVRLRVRLRDALAAPWLLTLSTCDLATLERDRAPAGRTHVVVPARSQMIEPEPIRRNICSPTSVAMVLERWGRRVETLTLAAEILHRALQRYGVWPAAVRAAGRYGVAGYLLRFPDWASVAWCLDAGLPIVASVNYTSGELVGAAMDATEGHLVVVTGYDDGAVLLNDPAAPTSDDVPRRVRRADLERAWLERAGVGYIFFDPSGR